MGTKCCKPETYEIGDIAKKNKPIGGKKFDEEDLDATTESKSGKSMKDKVAAAKAKA
jgi:hypothetical protein